MPTPENYARLFRNLAHMVALSQEEKVVGVVDSLVTTALTIILTYRQRLQRISVQTVSLLGVPSPLGE